MTEIRRQLKMSMTAILAGLVRVSDVYVLRNRGYTLLSDRAGEELAYPTCQQHRIYRFVCMFYADRVV